MGNMNKQVKAFVDFVREQGVVGLAVAFLLGGAISKVVTALIVDLVNPLLGLILGSTEGLKKATFNIGSAVFLCGDFVSNLIDFLVIALIVYYGVKMLGVDKLDKKK